MKSDERVFALRELCRRIPRFDVLQIDVRNSDLVREMGFTDAQEFADMLLEVFQLDAEGGLHQFEAIKNALAWEWTRSAPLGLRRDYYRSKVPMSERTLIRYETQGAELLFQYVDKLTRARMESPPDQQSLQSIDPIAEIKRLSNEVERIRAILRNHGLTDE